jgi:hypothetical protein
MPEFILAAIIGLVLPPLDDVPLNPTPLSRRLPEPSAEVVLRMLPDPVPAWDPTRSAPASRAISDEPASWTSLGFRNDGGKLSVGHDLSLDFASVNSKVSLIGPDNSVPVRRTGWQSEDSLKLPFNRTFFIVSKVGADSGSLEEQQYKLTGSTGLGVRLPFGGELQVRRGHSLTNYDSDALSLIPEHSKDFVELTTKWTLPGDFKLEYTQESVSPQTPLDRSKTTRDLRIAYPLPKDGQIHIGAKYESTDTTLPQPWVDRMKIYMGLILKR